MNFLVGGILWQYQRQNPEVMDNRCTAPILLEITLRKAAVFSKSWKSWDDQKRSCQGLFLKLRVTVLLLGTVRGAVSKKQRAKKED